MHADAASRVGLTWALETMVDMPRLKNPLLRALAMFAAVAILSILGALDRASSRHDVPMLSYDALALGWPYWCGGLVGAGLFGTVWYVRNRRGSDGP